MEGSTEGTAARKEEKQEEGIKANMTGDHWAGGLKQTKIYHHDDVMSLSNSVLTLNAKPSNSSLNRSYTSLRSLRWFYFGLLLCKVTPWKA